MATMGKLRDITKNVERAELKGTTAELANQLADAQFKVAELKGDLLRLQEENKGLKRRHEEQKPTVKWGCYQFGDAKNLYYPACYEAPDHSHSSRSADVFGLQSRALLIAVNSTKSASP